MSLGLRWRVIDPPVLTRWRGPAANQIGLTQSQPPSSATAIVGPAGLSGAQLATGWGSYRDTQYTIGAPFSLAPNSQTLLPNNAGSVTETQLPPDVDSFFDPATGRIAGTLGSDVIITLKMKIAATDVDATYFALMFDVGPNGNQVVLDQQMRDVPYGGAVGAFSFIISTYRLTNFVANGGRFWVTSDGHLNVYDISLLVKRTHQGR